MSDSIEQPLDASIEIRNLGRIGYAPAYEIQVGALEEVKKSRGTKRPIAAIILIVEHDPVITVSRRAGAADHLLASSDTLRAMGVDLAETDRGGDITYHGPGQLVLYPIVDLNLLNIGLHEYMRLLEDAVIATCAQYGVDAGRESGATGVWVRESAAARGTSAKICAMGVRVSRWVSMHGLALNISTNLEHFRLIVPCGLTGRAVTSLVQETGRTLTFAEVANVLTERLCVQIRGALESARQKRGARAGEGEFSG